MKMLATDWSNLVAVGWPILHSYKQGCHTWDVHVSLFHQSDVIIMFINNMFLTPVSSTPSSSWESPRFSLGSIRTACTVTINILFLELLPSEKKKNSFMPDYDNNVVDNWKDDIHWKRKLTKIWQWFLTSIGYIEGGQLRNRRRRQESVACKLDTPPHPWISLWLYWKEWSRTCSPTPL